MPLPGEPLNGPLPEAEAHLLGQLRDGDGEAGHRFVRDYYPPVAGTGHSRFWDTVWVDK